MNKKLAEITLIFLRLGLSAFGGPIAHLAYFHDESVVRRNWLTQERYLEIVALCQFLPGPASSQVAMSIGLLMAGPIGLLCAFIAFTLPSALVMTMLALLVKGSEQSIDAGLLMGFTMATFVVVSKALISMGLKLINSKAQLLLVGLFTVCALFLNGPLSQIILISLGCLCGLFISVTSANKDTITQPDFIPHTSSKFVSVAAVVFVLLLLLPPLFLEPHTSREIHQLSSFFRIGSLVFGGGHVVLPLLESEIVSNNILSRDLFMAGYAFAQALPGPMFAFSSYLGALSAQNISPWLNSLSLLLAIFLPSILLVISIVPIWNRVRKIKWLMKAVTGANFAVLGLLAATLFQITRPIATQNILAIMISLIMLFIHFKTRAPAWLIVALCSGAGYLIQ